MQWKEGLSLLTMDVTALYCNIDHNIGIHCINTDVELDLEVAPP